MLTNLDVRSVENVVRLFKPSSAESFYLTQPIRFVATMAGWEVTLSVALSWKMEAIFVLRIVG